MLSDIFPKSRLLSGCFENFRSKWNVTGLAKKIIMLETLVAAASVVVVAVLLRDVMILVKLDESNRTSCS